MIQLKRVKKKSEPQVANDKNIKVIDCNSQKDQPADIENLKASERVIDEFSIEESEAISGMTFAQLL